MKVYQDHYNDKEKGFTLPNLKLIVKYPVGLGRVARIYKYIQCIQSENKDGNICI